jgi:hypothetical protein
MAEERIMTFHKIIRMEYHSRAVDGFYQVHLVGGRRGPIVDLNKIIRIVEHPSRAVNGFYQVHLVGAGGADYYLSPGEAAAVGAINRPLQAV